MTNIGSGPGIGTGSQFEVNSARAAAATAAATSTPSATTTTPAATTTASPATTTASPAATTAVSGTTTAVSGTLGTGGAAIDVDRVSAISKAIKSGSYPLIPTKIGDAMIAAGVMLRTAS